MRVVRAVCEGTHPKADSSSQPRVAPTSATMKVSAGGPAMAAQPCVGTPAWLIASLPQGKPPQGQRSLNASAATHQPATASGHQRRLSSSRCATVNTAKMSAEAMASATQANQARLITQATSGKKKARPKTRPTDERGAQRAPVQGDDKQRRADEGERPQAVRRERRRQQQSGRQGDQQRPMQPERRPRRDARVGRRARGGLVLRVCVGLTRDHLRRVDGMRARRENGWNHHRVTLGARYDPNGAR